MTVELFQSHSRHRCSRSCKNEFEKRMAWVISENIVLRYQNFDKFSKKVVEFARQVVKLAVCVIDGVRFGFTVRFVLLSEKGC